jgi:hypothetical protein
MINLRFGLLDRERVIQSMNNIDVISNNAALVGLEPRNIQVCRRSH